MFHHVNRHARDFVTVHTATFEAMMERLHREGYTTLSSEQFRRFKLGLQKVPPKTVLLTFDDAWLDVYLEAFPILQRYGFQFTVFAVSDWTEASSRNPRRADPPGFPLHSEAKKFIGTSHVGEVICSWEDLEAMLKSGLCSIENHTASHRMEKDLRSDIQKGREAIQKNLGVSGNQLCWPHGRHDRRSLALARELGIDITYLVRRGVNLPRLCNHKVKRFTVKDKDADWLLRQLQIFSRPVYGYLYSRIKPDQRKQRWPFNKISRP